MQKGKSQAFFTYKQMQKPKTKYLLTESSNVLKIIIIFKEYKDSSALEKISI